MKAIGIDIGGSAVKGAVVNLKTGKLESDRLRIPTPTPSTPKAISRVVARIAAHFEWKGLIGCGMPGAIKHGKLMAIANLDQSWVGTAASEVFGKACGAKVAVINDADAAGLAEMRFGAGKNQRGVVVVVTLGTGIGSAVFVNGALLPNSELGQMEVRGKTAEQRAAARIRKEKNLSWEKYGKRLNESFLALEMLIWPDLIIVGGGVSRKANKFLPLLTTHARVVPARLGNEAGIVGAALSTMQRSAG